MDYQSQYSSLIIRITNGHNPRNTDPSVPIFLSHVNFVMVQVCNKFKNNNNKCCWSYRAKSYLLADDGVTEFQNDVMKDMLKTVYPIKRGLRVYKKHFPEFNLGWLPFHG